MIGGVNGRPETLENKVARVVAEHYGVSDFVIERAGVVHILRMSEDARQVIVNEAIRQSAMRATKRGANFAARERAA